MIDHTKVGRQAMIDDDIPLWDRMKDAEHKLQQIADLIATWTVANDTHPSLDDAAVQIARIILGTCYDCGHPTHDSFLGCSECECPECDEMDYADGTKARPNDG